MKIRILDRAEIDLVEGFRFYEAQAAGIGTYFLDSLASDIDSLRLYAGIHSVRDLLQNFGPHCWIYAVLDCRRSPAWIRERLRD